MTKDKAKPKNIKHIHVHGTQRAKSSLPHMCLLQQTCGGEICELREPPSVGPQNERERERMYLAYCFPRNVKGFASEGTFE